MTLIARMSFEDIPSYLGDLLLSREGKHTQIVDIPAARNINSLLPTSATRSIIALRQKVNILSDELIVAWAGSYSQARVAMRDMLQMQQNGRLNNQSFEEYINAADPRDINDLSLLATKCTPSNNGQHGVTFEHIDFNFNEMKKNGEAHATCGSGTDTFFNIIPQVTKSLRRVKRGSSKAFTQVEALTGC